jgi:hypothetical protein
MKIIMARPNGWGAREEGLLRTAAVAAGLSTTANSHRQIAFVSEAEASLQFCLSSTQLASSLSVSLISMWFCLEAYQLLKLGMNLVICDAGGSTIDTTVYNVTAVEPLLELKEVKSSACKTHYLCLSFLP